MCSGKWVTLLQLFKAGSAAWSLLECSTFIFFFLQALLAEQESKDSGGASIAEQVLSIMEIILDEANAEISEDKVKL